MAIEQYDLLKCASSLITDKPPFAHCGQGDLLTFGHVHHSRLQDAAALRTQRRRKSLRTRIDGVAKEGKRLISERLPIFGAAAQFVA
jgi:hypothetical protein